jgi:hypothetical protein
MQITMEICRSTSNYNLFSVCGVFEDAGSSSDNTELYNWIISK